MQRSELGDLGWNRTHARLPVFSIIAVGWSSEAPLWWISLQLATNGEATHSLTRTISGTEQSEYHILPLVAP